jgi:hypothetical protein
VLARRPTAERLRCRLVEIGRFEWWEPNIAKLREHRIAPSEVDSMLAVDAWVIALHADHPDQVRIIGPTAAGRLLTIALAPTGDAAVWRPVTG